MWNLLVNYCKEVRWITRILFKIEKIQIHLRSTIFMICGACEGRKHYECIDCTNNHETHLCHCDCHDENTAPHAVDGLTKFKIRSH
jgi:hypothetical protein